MIPRVWLSIGVGVHAGRTFVGSIGVDGGNYQFAALGDPMNFCARLVAAAKDREMIVSEAVWQDLSVNIPAEPRSLEFKGYTEPIRAYVTRAAVPYPHSDKDRRRRTVRSTS